MLAASFRSQLTPRNLLSSWHLSKPELLLGVPLYEAWRDFFKNSLAFSALAVSNGELLRFARSLGRIPEISGAYQICRRIHRQHKVCGHSGTGPDVRQKINFGRIWTGPCRIGVRDGTASPAIRPDVRNGERKGQHHRRGNQGSGSLCGLCQMELRFTPMISTIPSFPRPRTAFTGCLRTPRFPCCPPRLPFVKRECALARN